ncbi:DUF5682 family protein [Streptomyces marispadix]|uniref:DUF5682 family protein n=1 Tax=Streptomyces marispadix TaxID=2922868 RepID=A0ABS9T0V0_9ACTN|nr:DUF5682 family protein [Streptomyces marispadix]MCH6162149.1 DUF5682 family protein [Streptomyces marispadix]
MTAAQARAPGHGAPGRDAPGPAASELPDAPLLLGVRHHGPGSARAVRAALEARRPRVLLVEGPPEADGVVEFAGDEAMRPPVALVAHAPDEPGRAAFWPFAAFSPEWVAIKWALEQGVPVRFIDLPAANSLAARTSEDSRTGENDERDVDGRGADGRGTDGQEPDGRGGDGQSGDSERTPGEGEFATAYGDERSGPPAADPVRVDPLAVLAETAGYDDAERWWEDVVEHRGARTGSDPYAPFAVLGEAMAALREEHGEAEGTRPAGDAGDRRDEVREAHMRLRLRDAVREFGAGGVAVVCGAWHVPALTAKTRVADDRRLLKGLPKVKAEITWVPWTHRRLARHSGYGAGITSPGWYGHLFESPDRVVERWMTKVARLLRDEDRGVSSAHVIEAVRLADALAVMRGRPLAGLTETLDAVRAVMCDGSDVPLVLIRDRLVVGDVLGEVPEAAPAVPLQRDLARQQRTLRLKPQAGERELDLDLRKETDSARSRLLHRLRLLGIGWGTPVHSRTGSTGTFRESWRLMWEPELSVRTAEAGVWGTTVESAATAKAVSQAQEAVELTEVTALAEQCLLAELPDALTVVMRALADRAALDSDVGRLASALPALVRSVRYGNVRGTDSAALTEVAYGLAERVCVGLPPACAGLDADGAARMRDHVDAVHRSVALLSQSSGAMEADATDPDAAHVDTDEADATELAARDVAALGVAAPGVAAGEADGAESSGRSASAESPRPHRPHRPSGIRSRWRAVLGRLASRDRIPGLIRGRCVRLLLDDAQLTHSQAARLMGLALSPGTAPSEAAAWIEGFLAGGGLLLVHDERLLGLVDGWLASVPGESFTDVLPLLRRTFAEFEPGVRRTVGELVRRGCHFTAADMGVGQGGPTGASGLAPGFPLRRIRPGLEGFGQGLDVARAGGVMPTLRLLLGQPQPEGGGPAEARSAQVPAGAGDFETATTHATHAGREQAGPETHDKEAAV